MLGSGARAALDFDVDEDSSSRGPFRRSNVSREPLRPDPNHPAWRDQGPFFHSAGVPRNPMRVARAAAEPMAGGRLWYRSRRHWYEETQPWSNPLRWEFREDPDGETYVAAVYETEDAAEDAPEGNGDAAIPEEQGNGHGVIAEDDDEGVIPQDDDEMDSEEDGQYGYRHNDDDEVGEHGSEGDGDAESQDDSTTDSKDQDSVASHVVRVVNRTALKRPRKLPKSLVRRIRMPTKRRLKPGRGAIREIRKFQGQKKENFHRKDKRGNLHFVPRQFYHTKDATRLLINKTSLQKVVREIARDIKSDCFFSIDALRILHHAAESHLVEFFQDANLCAIAEKRETLKVADMRLACKIRREPLPRNLDDWLEDNPQCFYREADGTAPGLSRTDGVPHNLPAHTITRQKQKNIRNKRKTL